MPEDFFSADQHQPIETAGSDGGSFSGVFLWIGVGVLCVALLVVVGFRLRKLFRREEFSGMSREDLTRRWSALEELAGKKDEMSMKVAIMEADKLLDYGLKSIGCSGSTLGERLKFIAYRYPKIQRVWPAHILRNKMVHDASFHLNHGEARRALKAFREALREIGVF
ncbi:MAG: hypothetical protein AAB416_03355 [Patescibacteria group bacterium]